MSRTTQILGFSVPPALAKEVSRLAKEERRTKSELFREMVRVYRRYRSARDRDDDRLVMRIVQEAEVEQARDPMSVEEMLKQSERFARAGAARAKKLGIKTDLRSATKLIHERRKANRPA
jgi:metal-responsive CopG/Arc/MetJ family transcriptional regulator